MHQQIASIEARFKGKNGVPQGGVLSCLCFLMAINSVEDVIPRSIKVQIFSDDLSISLTTNNHKYSKSLLQQTLLNLETWSNTTGMDFSPFKTKYMIFTRRKKYQLLQLWLNKNRLPQTDGHTFLGVIFDNNLTWTTHLKQLQCQRHQRLNILKMLPLGPA